MEINSQYNKLTLLNLNANERLLSLSLRLSLPHGLLNDKESYFHSPPCLFFLLKEVRASVNCHVGMEVSSYIDI